MSKLHPTIERVTQRIIEKSKGTRRRYLDLIAHEGDNQPDRSAISCSNLAHAFAAAQEDQPALKSGRGVNIGIVNSYNDMLSAHQPYGRYPERLKIYARQVGATAQVAGAAPAMCDGVTQGQDGMEISLFSRDVIALSTSVALSHAMYDGALLLGICDKIVPGLVIGALRFGHLPAIFVPSGPMPSGIGNKEKQRVRQLFAQGKASRAQLLENESASYHSPGTCTFFGTANSNQMMMELMGLHIPGSAFVPPGTQLRHALDKEAVHRVAALGRDGDDYRPLGRCVDEKAIVNAAVGLLATGGSTNHAIHIPAMARAAGVQIDWSDLSELSSAIPLIAHIYPNGSGDVNQFHNAGGMAYVIDELLGAGMVHRDIMTVGGEDLGCYAKKADLSGDELIWQPVSHSSDDSILRPVSLPFQDHGGMQLVKGNLGRATFKTSAVEANRHTIEAPCRIFNAQHEVSQAFARGELDCDVVVVVRFQGPRANGMPELHKLTAPLGVLQDRGYKVALVSDGRMSGASGKIPAAIHCTPEALGGGPLSLLRDGDIVRLSAEDGTLSTAADLASRKPASMPAATSGTGRELFAMFRNLADEAEKGGSAMLFAAGL